MRPVIALLTDFGLQDHYVGVMKGVILGICPEATLVDLTHDIAPQDVLGGALELAAAWRYFPESTVFLCVVDPGVGSARRAVAVRAAGRTFVAPDNGLVSLAVGEARAGIVELTNPRFTLPAVSSTFEGRDRFAPAAAWLAAGEPLSAFGPPLDDIVRVTVPAPRVSADAIDGEVVRVDRFGNLVTNISAEAIDRLGDRPHLSVSVRGCSSDGIANTYTQIRAADCGALVGSTGHLEISMNGGSAARAVGCGRGEPVRVARRA